MRKQKPTIDDAILKRAAAVLAAPTLSTVDLTTEYASLVSKYRTLLRKFLKTVIISDSYEAQRREMSEKLEETAAKYRQLKAVALPICMYCKKIRSDDDYWQQLETFLYNNADIMFSHGICPDCIKTAYSKMGLNKEQVITPNSAVGIPAIRGGRELTEDDALRDMRALVRQCSVEGRPLAPEVEQFVTRYGKLLRRFNKTVSISDNYQSQLMELKSRLELMARTDLLTGLSNRWDMVARLEAEKSRSERHGKPFSILIADIDHFKQVNDTFGHLAGDRVLRSIADTFRSNTRSEDICCRWGGEEFLFILPETDLNRAGAFVDKTINVVRKLVIPWDGHEIRVTVSIGYGVFIPGIDINECLRQVDGALSNAKFTGRDRAVAVIEPDQELK